MKKLGILLFLIIFTCTGCSNKFQGTWCKFSDTRSSLVILKNNVTDKQIENIVNYISKIPNLKSYDKINKIEESSQMITIYYTNSEAISETENAIKKLSGVDSVKTSTLNTVVNKLTINKKNYIYDYSLDNEYANSINGKYEISNDKIKLDNNMTFYYRNNFLCYDEECNDVLTKSKDNTCNN